MRHGQYRVNYHRYHAPQFKKLNFDKYCFESRLVEAIERAMDPYIGIKQDRDDDELDDNEIRSVGVFVNDSESFIKDYPQSDLRL